MIDYHTKDYGLMVYIGRDYRCDLPLNIFIGLFPHGKPETWVEGELIPFRFKIDTSFQWCSSIRWRIMRYFSVRKLKRMKN